MRRLFPQSAPTSVLKGMHKYLLESAPRLVCVFALCLLLPACALRGAGKNAADTEVPQPPSFAEQVAMLPNGVAQPFAQSPYGAVSVTAGSTYVSGLGNQCRPINIVQGTMQYRAAVCREEQGWRVIPTIFDNMPR